MPAGALPSRAASQSVPPLQISFLPCRGGRITASDRWIYLRRPVRRSGTEDVTGISLGPHLSRLIGPCLPAFSRWELPPAHQSAGSSGESFFPGLTGPTTRGWMSCASTRGTARCGTLHPKWATSSPSKAQARAICPLSCQTPPPFSGRQMCAQPSGDLPAPTVVSSSDLFVPCRCFGCQAGAKSPSAPTGRRRKRPRRATNICWAGRSPAVVSLDRTHMIGPDKCANYLPAYLQFELDA